MSHDARHREPPRTDSTVALRERTQRILRPAAQRYLHRRWDIRLHGADRVPKTGPVILASNHIGWLDGPLLVAIAPRPVHALVKSEMFVGRTGRLLRASGQIPVVRNTIDIAAVRFCIRALRDDQVVAIYPEARRGNGEFERLRDGYTYLALVTGARVVPVAIFGTRESGEPVSSVPPAGRRLDVVYGEPIDIAAQPWPRTPGLVEATSRRLRTGLVEHLSEAQDLTGCTLPGRPPTPDPEGVDA